MKERVAPFVIAAGVVAGCSGVETEGATIPELTTPGPGSIAEYEGYAEEFTDAFGCRGLEATIGEMGVEIVIEQLDSAPIQSSEHVLSWYDHIDQQIVVDEDANARLDVHERRNLLFHEIGHACSGVAEFDLELAAQHGLIADDFTGNTLFATGTRGFLLVFDLVDNADNPSTFPVFEFGITLDEAVGELHALVSGSDELGGAYVDLANLVLIDAEAAGMTGEDVIDYYQQGDVLGFIAEMQQKDRREVSLADIIAYNRRLETIVFNVPAEG